MSTYCYWSVADGKHALMARTMIESARAVGDNTDFHIWTDQAIPGATTYPCGTFDKNFYLFKLTFLQQQAKKLNYDWLVWLDADNYFVRNPGNLAERFGDDRVFVQLESNCSSPEVKRGDWWNCPVPKYIEYMRQHGATTPDIYNTNAGFWAVRRDSIDELVDRAMAFWKYVRMQGHTFTEEAPLAHIGHVMAKDPLKNTFDKTSDLWACDWTGVFINGLPDGHEWPFEDYMTGEKKVVNPAIVHAMRCKDQMAK